MCRDISVNAPNTELGEELHPARAATIKVGGAAYAGCTLLGYHGQSASEGANGDGSTRVCVQLVTYLPLVMQPIFTVLSGCG